MVGHLHLQAMEESLKGKSREGLLDSPDSGLPPSPSPPFCPLSPSTAEPRTPIGADHHGVTCWRKEGREGKLLPYLLLNSQGAEVKSRMHPVGFGESIEVQLGGEVRLAPALPRRGLLCSGSHGDLLQRDDGGAAEPHVAQLQVRGSLPAPAPTRPLPEHDNRLPQTRVQRLPHHAALQRQRPPPLRVYGETGVERGRQSLRHLQRGAVRHAHHGDTHSLTLLYSGGETCGTAGDSRQGRGFVALLSAIKNNPENPTVRNTREKKTPTTFFASCINA